MHMLYFNYCARIGWLMCMRRLSLLGSEKHGVWWLIFLQYPLGMAFCHTQVWNQLKQFFSEKWLLNVYYCVYIYIWYDVNVYYWRGFCSLLSVSQDLFLLSSPKCFLTLHGWCIRFDVYKHQPSTVLRSASNLDLRLPRSRLKFGERAFRIVAPKVWNTLPLNVHQTSNTQTFKRNLKTVLFCTSYNIPTPTLSPADWHSMWFSYCNCFIVFYCILPYFIIILPHNCYRLVSTCCCKPLLSDIIIIIIIINYCEWLEPLVQTWPVCTPVNSRHFIYRRE